MTIIITYLKDFTIHPYKKPTSSQFQFQFQFKTISTLLTLKKKKHVKDRLTRGGTDESGTLALASKVSNEKSECDC